MANDDKCPLCGWNGVLTPNDHDCMGKLKHQLKELHSKYNPHGYADMDELCDNDIFLWERATSAIYEKMRALTQWHYDQVQLAEEQHSKAYNVQQEARREVVNLRGVARSRLEDPE